MNQGLPGYELQETALYIQIMSREVDILGTSCYILHSVSGKKQFSDTSEKDTYKG